jgi:hypothetical protein
MGRIARTAILGFFLCGTVLADIEKSIFDDDWQPSTPQVQTPAPPVSPTPTPKSPISMPIPTPRPSIPTPPVDVRINASIPPMRFRVVGDGKTLWRSKGVSVGSETNPGVRCPLPAGVRHKSEVRVRKESVAGYVDGNLIMEIKDFSEFPNSNQKSLLFRVFGNRQVEVHFLQLVEVTGVGRRLESRK